MTDLSHLLWSALRHADRDSLLDLIERKLSRPSMDVAQQAHWLAAGLILSADDIPRTVGEVCHRE